MNSQSADKRAATLRQHLRLATSSSHDRLDASMRPASDWQSRGDYVRFLSSQYGARLSVEAWLTNFAPAELTPPHQTPLLARDLAALGETPEEPAEQFELDYRSEATAIGVAWVLAGSSLGNRAMLHDMRRALPEGSEWPHEFLSSVKMTDFWKSLRPIVEAPAEPDDMAEASRAAASVFDHFLKAAGFDLANIADGGAL